MAGMPTAQPAVPQGLGTLPNGQLAGDLSTSGASAPDSGSNQGWFGSWFGGGDNSSPKVCGNNHMCLACQPSGGVCAYELRWCNYVVKCNISSSSPVSFVDVRVLSGPVLLVFKPEFCL